jgi:hypothetical protein
MRRTDTAEFKREAVELVKQKPLPVAAAARRLERMPNCRASDDAKRLAWLIASTSGTPPGRRATAA